MGRPITFVKLDIAKFLLRVLRVPEEKRGEWVTLLAETLAEGERGAHPYADELFEEVEEFRENDRNRHRGDSKDSKEKMDSKEKPDSVDSSNRHTDRHTGKQASNNFKEHVWFQNSAFAAAWAEWEKERKKKGGERQLDKVEKLSGGNLETAIAILKQSADNQWQGLFALNNAHRTFDRAAKPERSRGEHAENLRL